MVTSKATAYLLVACVFLLGVVAGGAAVMAWTSNERAAIWRDGPPAQRHKAHVLSRKLDLGVALREAGRPHGDARGALRDVAERDRRRLLLLRGRRRRDDLKSDGDEREGEREEHARVV